MRFAYQDRGSSSGEAPPTASLWSQGPLGAQGPHFCTNLKVSFVSFSQYIFYSTIHQLHASHVCVLSPKFQSSSPGLLPVWTPRASCRQPGAESFRTVSQHVKRGPVPAGPRQTLGTAFLNHLVQFNRMQEAHTLKHRSKTHLPASPAALVLRVAGTSRVERGKQ